MTRPSTISAVIRYNNIPAATLTRDGNTYYLTYLPDYLLAKGSRPVSITLPLRKEPYISKSLFPAFINMLSEGANKRLQSRLLKIDDTDYFSLLLATVHDDNIGPITVEKINETA